MKHNQKAAKINKVYYNKTPKHNGTNIQNIAISIGI